MTRSGWVWSWVGVSLAVSCALPELTIGEGDDSGDGEGAEGGSGLASGMSGSGKGGNTSGGSSGASSGGSGKGGSGKGGTDTGGSGAEGGTAGSSGGTDSGGSDGTGGQGGSTGGAGSGGKGGTSTGGSAGMGGGGAGTGGAGTGGAGKGGTGGAGKGGTGGAGTGGGGCPSVAQLFPTIAPLGSLDGRLITFPCTDTGSTDCTSAGFVYNGATTTCSGGSLTAQQDFTVGGAPGAMYTVQMHFYGILEPKNYGMNVTRESGNTRPANNNSGATPAPFAYTTTAGAVNFTPSDYGTHEIHVLDNSMQVFRQFFLNSDTSEGYWTYVIDYVKTIPVIGAGRIRMRHFDRNCREIKNCYNGGQGTVQECATRARTVDISAASPQPTGLVQPGLGNDDGNSGQWLLVDVVSVGCP